MPTTTGVATSFIDFTRASNATVTDSDGKVKWAPHNLLTNSESFDAAAWGTTAGVTLTANNAVAPNGTTTADNYAATNTVNYKGQTGITVIVTQYTQSCFAKRVNTDWVYMNISNSTDKGAWFNLATGVKGTEESGVTAAIQSVGSGWYLCSIAFTGIAGNAVAVLPRPRDGDGSTTTTVGGSVLLWGASLYRSDLGGMQPNTSAYPMYNPTTPKNLLGYTEDFSNAYWVKNAFLAFGSGSVANATTAPNGLQTADLLTPDTTLGLHRVVAPTATVPSGTPFRYTVYVKPNGYTKVAFREMATTGDYAAFSLIGAGSVLDKSASATASISALPDGWYLISTSIAVAATSIRYTIYVLDPLYTSGTVEVNWTPNGTSGVYLWGAQLSDSASLDSYVPVYGAAVTSAAYYGPRRDFDPVTLACKGLLVEEQRTNALQYSEEFTNAYWGTNATPTVTANTAIGPSGQQTADSVTGSGSNFSGVVKHLASTNGLTYASSVYIKSDTSPFAIVLVNNGNAGAWINLSTGAVTTTGTLASTPVATSVGNGWWRLTVVAVAGGTSNATIWVCPTSAGGVNTGTGNIFIWGAQLEAGSFATSYIPTGAATATRNADVASVSTQAFPYSETEGSIVFNFSPFSLSGLHGVFSIHQNATSASNRIDYRANGSNLVTVGGSDQGMPSAGTPLLNAVNKFAVGYKLNNYAAALNSGTVVTDSTAAVPPMDAFTIGKLASDNTLNGHIRQITYLPRRISNADLTARTA